MIFSDCNNSQFSLFQDISSSRATMYSEWSSLTLQLQTLGTATQSVLSKLPPEDGKQVRDT